MRSPIQTHSSASVASTPPDFQVVLLRASSLRELPLLPSSAQCPLWRHQFAELEQRIDRQMGPYALRGFSKFVEVGKSIALTVGAVAGMLTFVVGPHHLVLAVGVGSVVYGGFVLIGLVVELGLKCWTYRKVDAQTRQQLRTLCEELNARALAYGSSRSVEEQALAHAANSLWTDIHLSGRTFLRTLARSVADWELEPLKPQRKPASPPDSATSLLQAQ